MQILPSNVVNFGSRSACVIALTLCLVVAGAIAAENLEVLRAAHSVMLEDASLQHEFGVAEVKDQSAPGWLKAIGNAIRDFFAFIAPLVEIVFKIGLVVILCLAVFWAYRVVKGRFFDNKDEEEATEYYVPSKSLARTLLEDADALAAKGQFVDAVHLLLFRSIEDIEKHRPNAVNVAMTSREIAQLEILPQASRGPFSKIAQAVEQSMFAGRPLNESLFQECRAAYEKFAQPEGWR